MAVQTPRRIRIIYNPAAGWRRRMRLERVLAQLRALGCGIALDETAAPGDAEAYARGIDAAECDAVVAAGGDGTINEVMNGLDGAALPLGIVPLGTANVLATRSACRATRAPSPRASPSAGRCRSIRGSANGRRFAMMAGIGFDARVVAGLDLGLKRAFGKAAYAASALAALARHARCAYAVEIDGAAFAAAAVVIAKGRYYGGRFVIASRARLDEPVLQVALFAGERRGDLLRYARALATNRIEAQGDVRVLPAREVRIAGPAGERVQLDGDLAAGLLLVVTVAAAPLALLR